jgi:hypothetical protein
MAFSSRLQDGSSRRFVLTPNEEGDWNRRLYYFFSILVLEAAGVSEAVKASTINRCPP